MKSKLICGLHRDAPERVDAIFPFPALLISSCSESGTPFLSESVKECQHYFSVFLKANAKDTLPSEYRRRLCPRNTQMQISKKNDECRMSNDEGMTKIRMSE